MADGASARAQQFVDASQRAPIVFVGIVARSSDSNVEALRAVGDRTAIVRIEQVIDAPATLGELTGQEITVRLAADEPAMKRGQRLAIAANSLVYAENVGVDELARFAPGRATATVVRTVIEARTRALDDLLVARLSRAESVVYGRCDVVAGYEAEASTAESEPVGEAAPGWRIATVTAWRSLKGTPDSPVRVVFAYPRTQKWREAPLFVAEQEGIWLLHRIVRDDERPAWRPPPVAGAYHAPDPLDFHAPSAIDRLRLLLNLETGG